MASRKNIVFFFEHNEVDDLTNLDTLFSAPWNESICVELQHALQDSLLRPMKQVAAARNADRGGEAKWFSD